MTRSTGPESNSRQRPYGSHNMLDWGFFRSSFLIEDTRPIREIKSRRPPPKVTKPSNWKDSEVVESYNKKSDPSYALSLVTIVNDKTLASFPTGRPLHESVDLVQCKHCRKPVARLGATPHIRLCLKKKQEKLQKKKEAKEAKDAAARREKGEDEDGRKAKGGKKSAVKGSTTEAKKSKKRKAESGSSGGPSSGAGPGAGAGTAGGTSKDTPTEKPPTKKKKKDEPKAKQPKVKMPVDVEAQCGVILPNGSQCARSLTCKSHSMGAKRAVPGRSLPYDMLLAQYQKKNQAKQQRAAIDANAPGVDEFEANGPVDPEEEKNQILGALSRAFPRPIYHPPPVDIRRKYQHVRLKGILGGLRGSGLFRTAAGGGGGGGAGAGAAFGAGNAANGGGSGGLNGTRRDSAGANGASTNGTSNPASHPVSNGALGVGGTTIPPIPTSASDGVESHRSNGGGVSGSGAIGAGSGVSGPSPDGLGHGTGAGNGHDQSKLRSEASSIKDPKSSMISPVSEVLSAA